MMHGDEVTLAEMLKPAGYRSGIFGKWHLGDNYPLRSMDQGFEDSLVLNGGGLLQPGDVPEDLTGVAPSYFNPVLSRNGKWEAQKGYCTDIYFREAMRFIDEQRARPFFCYLPTNAPHTPLEVDPALAEPFRKMGLDDATAKIYGMVRNIDDNVGRLLAHLKARNLERDTIVMFMTDNGPQQKRFNSGLRGLKGTPYEGGIRVPLLVRWPGRIAPGTIVDRLSAHIDVAPTVLEAVGAKSMSAMDGRSLWPLLTNPKAKATWSDRTMFLQWHRGDVPRAFENSAVLTQRYKLVNGKELYDLEMDLGEVKDLSQEQPDIVRQLRTSYEAWFQDVSSTRGYAPPRIVFDGKSSVLLTRQDWRGPQASWTPTGVGYWEVTVASAGPYDVTLLFDESDAKRTLKASWLGEHSIQAGQKRLELKAVKLPKGAARFEATVGEQGLKYAWFRPSSNVGASVKNQLNFDTRC